MSSVLINQKTHTLFTLPLSSNLNITLVNSRLEIVRKSGRCPSIKFETNHPDEGRWHNYAGKISEAPGYFDKDRSYATYLIVTIPEDYAGNLTLRVSGETHKLGNWKGGSLSITTSKGRLNTCWVEADHITLKRELHLNLSGDTTAKLGHVTVALASMKLADTSRLNNTGLHTKKLKATLTDKAACYMAFGKAEQGSISLEGRALVEHIEFYYGQREGRTYQTPGKSVISWDAGPEFSR